MDVEAWLMSIDPRIIDAWLAFEAVEPDAFGASPGRESGGDRASGPLLDAREAARKMAQRLG